MSADFTASNGVTVHRLERGLGFSGVAGDAVIGESSAGLSKYGINERKAAALREFFRAEDDERLGRWRSVKHPGWSAVRRNAVVYFQHENHEQSFHIIVGNTSSMKAWAHDLQAVAGQYLDAHPEPKPWHDAKPGEVWALTIGDETFAWGVGDGVDAGKFLYAGGESNIPIRFPEITAGRRIWPES